MDKRLLEVLACPLCQGKLYYDHSRPALICKYDRLAYPIEDSIPIMLPERAQALAQEELDALN